MRSLNLLLLTALFLIAGNISAQSLKAEKPYPLQEGINKGTSDSLVGTHYWYFYATPGSNNLTVRLAKSTTLYGSQMSNNSLTITLTDDKRTWKTTKIINANKNSQEAVFAADKIKSRTKIIVSVAPPGQNLIRMGGEYEVEASGDVEFDAMKNSVEPIVRTYESKMNSYGTVRFLADGTIETANGAGGKWKVFDAENHIYTIVIEDYRVSLQFIPGYGLVKPNEPDMIIFQELRR